VFRGPIASSYGSTEAGYVFMQCEHGRLHQNSEFCRVDWLPLVEGLPSARWRPRGDVARTELGRLLVTTFGNRWFPLLRFDIGDVGRVAAEPCPCGRSFGLVLSAIEGRHKSLCLAADGRLLTHREIDHALARIDGLCDYQLVQHSPNSVALAVVASDGQGGRVVTDARELLRGLFGTAPSVAVTETAALAPEPSGKFLLVKREFAFDGEPQPPAQPRVRAGRADA
jgi:phenylacetate-CoA ligase